MWSFDVELYEQMTVSSVSLLLVEVYQQQDVFKETCLSPCLCALPPT